MDSPSKPKVVSGHAPAAHPIIKKYEQISQGVESEVLTEMTPSRARADQFLDSIKERTPQNNYQMNQQFQNDQRNQNSNRFKESQNINQAQNSNYHHSLPNQILNTANNLQREISQSHRQSTSPLESYSQTSSFQQLPNPLIVDKSLGKQFSHQNLPQTQNAQQDIQMQQIANQLQIMSQNGNSRSQSIQNMTSYAQNSTNQSQNPLPNNHISTFGSQQNQVPNNQQNCQINLLVSQLFGNQATQNNFLGLNNLNQNQVWQNQSLSQQSVHSQQQFFTPLNESFQSNLTQNLNQNQINPLLLNNSNSYAQNSQNLNQMSQMNNQIQQIKNSIIQIEQQNQLNGPQTDAIDHMNIFLLSKLLESQQSSQINSSQEIQLNQQPQTTSIQQNQVQQALLMQLQAQNNLQKLENTQTNLNQQVEVQSQNYNVARNSKSPSIGPQNFGQGVQNPQLQQISANVDSYKKLVENYYQKQQTPKKSKEWLNQNFQEPQKAQTLRSPLQQSISAQFLTPSRVKNFSSDLTPDRSVDNLVQTGFSTQRRQDRDLISQRMQQSTEVKSDRQQVNHLKSYTSPNPLEDQKDSQKSRQKHLNSNQKDLNDKVEPHETSLTFLNSKKEGQVLDVDKVKNQEIVAQDDTIGKRLFSKQNSSDLSIQSFVQPLEQENSGQQNLQTKFENRFENTNGENNLNANPSKIGQAIGGSTFSPIESQHNMTENQTGNPSATDERTSHKQGDLSSDFFKEFAAVGESEQASNNNQEKQNTHKRQQLNNQEDLLRETQGKQKINVDERIILDKKPTINVEEKPILPQQHLTFEDMLKKQLENQNLRNETPNRKQKLQDTASMEMDINTESPNQNSIKYKVDSKEKSELKEKKTFLKRNSKTKYNPNQGSKNESSGQKSQNQSNKKYRYYTDNFSQKKSLPQKSESKNNSPDEQSNQVVVQVKTKNIKKQMVQIQQKEIPNVIEGNHKKAKHQGISLNESSQLSTRLKFKNPQSSSRQSQTPLKNTNTKLITHEPLKIIDKQPTLNSQVQPLSGFSTDEQPKRLGKFYAQRVSTNRLAQSKSLFTKQPKNQNSPGLESTQKQPNNQIQPQKRQNQGSQQRQTTPLKLSQDDTTKKQIKQQNEFDKSQINASNHKDKETISLQIPNINGVEHNSVLEFEIIEKKCKLGDNSSSNEQSGKFSNETESKTNKNLDRPLSQDLDKRTPDMPKTKTSQFSDKVQKMIEKEAQPPLNSSFISQNSRVSSNTQLIKQRLESEHKLELNQLKREKERFIFMQSECQRQLERLNQESKELEKSQQVVNQKDLDYKRIKSQLKVKDKEIVDLQARLINFDEENQSLKDSNRGLIQQIAEISCKLTQDQQCQTNEVKMRHVMINTDPQQSPKQVAQEIYTSLVIPLNESENELTPRNIQESHLELENNSRFIPEEIKLRSALIENTNQIQIEKQKSKKVAFQDDLKLNLKPNPANEKSLQRELEEIYQNFETENDQKRAQGSDVDEEVDQQISSEEFGMIFPEEYHGVSQNQLELIDEQKSSEGKIQRLYKCGKREVVFPNGVKREVWPDGYQVVFFVNEDVKQTFKDGRLVYYFAEAETTQTTFPDGIQVFKFKNNQIEKHFCDGTKEITFPDGTVKCLYPDGEEESVFPDGTIQKIDKDGLRTIEYPHGQVDHMFPDGVKIREFANGGVKKYYPDGRIETTE